MSDSTPWTTDIYLVLPDPESGYFLTRNQTLPHLRSELRFWIEDVAEIGGLLEADLGQVSILRCLEYHSDREASHTRIIYELEALERLEGEWVSADDFEKLDMSQEVSVVIKNYLQTPQSELRAPWAKVGWYKQASAWSKAQLSQLGYQVISIKQVKTWGISSILKINTDREAVYFKVAAWPKAPDPLFAAPLFCHEPLLTQALVERFPDNLPKILAIEPTQHWMLSADFGATSKEASLETWQAMLQTYANLQKSLIGQEDWLFEIGCLDRRLSVLKMQFSALLESPILEKNLGADEAVQLRNLGPQLLEDCDRLQALGIPYTLMHGDLHAGNFVIQGNRFIFFDWTDACVAHPFMDLPLLLERLPESLGETARDTLTQTYLSCWTEYGSLETLEASLPLVRLASDLHQAVSYWRINQGLEPLVRHELGTGLPYFLCKILEEAKEQGNISG